MCEHGRFETYLTIIRPYMKKPIKNKKAKSKAIQSYEKLDHIKISLQSHMVNAVHLCEFFEKKGYSDNQILAIISTYLATLLNMRKITYEDLEDMTQMSSKLYNLFQAIDEQEKST